MAKRVLIKGGCVLSMDRSVGNHVQADVLTEDGIISEVGRGLRARDAEVVDATDTIVMPGFVDTHRHTWKTLFRNLGRGVAVESQIGPDVYGPHHQPDDIYAAILTGLLSAAEGGITTVVDWADIHHEKAFTEAVTQAHADSGLRTVLVRAAPPWLTGGGTEAAVLETLRAADPATTAYGAAAPGGYDFDQLSMAWESARREGLRIHTHVGRQLLEQGVVAELASRGLLGEDVTFVHCTNLSDPDLDAVAASGAKVSLTPSREMAGGLGAPPLQAFIDRGIRPGLGIGDEVEAPGDLFAQMRAANSIQHATLFDLKLSGKAGIPNLLSTREVIRYGTIDGARTAGLDSITGSLTPGKQADITILRADRPNIAPINDPIGAVVWGMDTSNVDWVLVGGEIVMRDGQLRADVSHVRQLAAAAHDRVAAAAGLLTTATEVS